MLRKVSEIAAEISSDWKNVNPAAEPYLNAMFYLEDINDMYIAERGSMVVAYFLANAGTWRGETARNVKKELNSMIK